MKAIIIENVRGQWVVDRDTEVFVEEGVAYSDGALFKLEISKSESLCHHPNNPAVCSYCGK